MSVIICDSTLQNVRTEIISKYIFEYVTLVRKVVLKSWNEGFVLIGIPTVTQK